MRTIAAEKEDALYIYAERGINNFPWGLEIDYFQYRRASYPVIKLQ